MSGLISDIRFGARLLRRRPAFTLAAATLLALGLGVNTLIFSVVNTVLLRPPEIAAPERVIRLDTGISHASHATYRAFQKAESLSELAAYSASTFNCALGDETLKAFGQLVTANYFRTLGIDAAVGRTFGEEVESDPSSRDVAVISHGFWRRTFGGDPGVIGRRLPVNGRSLTILGVMPDGFRGTYPFFVAPEIWSPIVLQPLFQPGRNRFEDPHDNWLELVGRLSPGVAVPAARAELRALGERLAAADPETPWLERVELYPLYGLSAFRGLSFAPALLIFLALLSAVVAMVLLLACFNVAGLLLARSWERRREAAVRAALGAGRWRLVRQFLTESLLLGLLGGGTGCLFAFWGAAALNRFSLPVPIPLELDIQIDARVLAYCLLASVLTTLLFGLVPARRASRFNLVPALRGASAGGRVRSRLREAMVTAQVAISLLLLTCAGLFVRSLQASQQVDPGFDADRLLALDLDLGSAGYTVASSRTFYDQLLERVRGLAGVESASLARIIPLSFGRIEFGVVPASNAEPIHVSSNTVDVGFFQTMEIPLLAGRDFSSADVPGSPNVAIVNRTAARLLWSGEDPIGRSLHIPGLDQEPFDVEIVGLVEDSPYRSLGEDPTPLLYLPFRQRVESEMALFVRTVSNAGAWRKGVLQTVRELDPTIATEADTMRENLQLSLFPARVGAYLLGAFGILGLALATVGLYGLISYSVSTRFKEIGIRMALGAQTLDIAPLVLGQVFRLAGGGIGLGLVLSFLMTRFLGSLLVGVEPFDPLTFASTAALLLMVALLASFLPTRRACRADAAASLHRE